MLYAGIGLTLSVKNILESVNITDDGLVERISSYLLRSRADKTNDQYRAYYNKFQQFCAVINSEPYRCIYFRFKFIEQNCSCSVLFAVFYVVK